jgi:hypothetical protein
MDNDLLGADQMPSAYEDWRKVNTQPKFPWGNVLEGTLYVMVFLGMLFAILIWFGQ